MLFIILGVKTMNVLEGGKVEEMGDLQEMGLAEVLTGVDRVTVELLLNAEQLVVLGQALRAITREEKREEVEIVRKQSLA